MKKIAITLAAATSLLAAAPAFAQAGPSTSANANASAEIVEPIAISNVDGLNFGRIAAGGGGTVTINANGSLSSSSPNMLVGGPQNGSAATFNVTGEGGLAYTRSVPASVTLNSGGNSMSASLSGGGADALDASGNDSFDVLGVLTVANGQAAGDYSGTFAVSVQYN